MERWLRACGVGSCSAALLLACAVSQAGADQAAPPSRSAAALEMPVLLQFDDVPLRLAVAALAEQARLPIEWDEAGLIDAALPADETVAVSTAQAMALRRALRLILEPLQLTWEDEGDRLRITSRRHWQQRIVTQTHDVADLTADAAASQQLLATLRQEIERSEAAAGVTIDDEWELRDGRLRVVHCRRVQADLQRILDDLRALRASQR